MKKAIVLLLIVATIIASLLYIVPIIKPPPPTLPPTTPPPKTEAMELKVGESALVYGNLIKLISIEGEEGIVEIEVLNETTGEPMVVPLNFKKGGIGFNYKNMSIFAIKVEDNKTTLLFVSPPN
jgi:hypothetical protein